MKRLANWAAHGAEAIAAALLAALFVTFLVQIFSRHLMQTPFGWTLELCLVLWVWLVFFAAAFTLRERDHVRFDILYRAAPHRLRRIMALVSAAAIALAMAASFLPTWDYIDWMAIRKTATVRNPVTGSGVPLRTVFAVYALFMLALVVRYTWRIVTVLRHGPPDGDTPEDTPGDAP